MFEDSRLKLFHTVCRTGSFTKAARILSVTQPAVSQNIAELERTLGFSLFERRSGKIELTPQGELFSRYAENVLQSYDNLNTLFNIGAPDLPVTLRVFASPLVADSVLQPIVHSFGILYPSTCVEIVDEIKDADVTIISEMDKTEEAHISFNVRFFPVSHPAAKIMRLILESL